NPNEYIDYFKQWTDNNCEVIHISLGSGISSSYQNARLASEELEGVYVIDSGNLSTCMGHLVLEAGDRINKGMPAAQIYEEVNQLKTKVHASFVIDTLTYLYEGGRCSALAALSANILNIKPCIEVDHTSGKTNIGKKYRGSLSRVYKRYTQEELKEHDDLKLDRIFITHSGTSSENIELVKKTIEETTNFNEIIVTQAGCTISSHCG